MKILTIILPLLLIGCASNTKKLEEAKKQEEMKKDVLDNVIEISEDNLISITLPSPTTQGIVRSPFLNTQRTEIFNKNGFKIVFYYGVGGRYLIQVTTPPHITLDFKKGEGTLLIDYSGNFPETLSLDGSADGIFQGQGNIRNGMVDFKLEFTAPADTGATFTKNIDFSISIYDNATLME